jgi:hypothetical protein
MESAKDKYDIIIEELAEHFSQLVLRWSESEFGSFDNWLQLLKNMMKFLQKEHGDLKGIEKAECASKAVVELSTRIYNKQTQDLSEEEKNNLKSGKLKMVVLVMENPDILKSATGILKQTLQVFDTNNDGEVSSDEIKGFFKSKLCCCCK